MQSELVLQWPQVPLEHVPIPAQSDVVLHSGSAAGARMPAGESAVIPATRRELSASNAGTGTGVAGLGSLAPHAHRAIARARTSFMPRW